jgi:hypothetical protein
VVFADGEIAGPDPSHYAAELQGRKRAAEYVAKHVRLAKLEERDPTPVVAALRDMPHLRSDLLAHLVCEYARTYLRQSSMRSGLVDWTEAALKHLENRPNLPSSTDSTTWSRLHQPETLRPCESGPSAHSGSETESRRLILLACLESRVVGKFGPPGTGKGRSWR